MWADSWFKWCAREVRTRGGGGGVIRPTRVCRTVASDPYGSSVIRCTPTLYSLLLRKSYLLMSSCSLLCVRVRFCLIWQPFYVCPCLRAHLAHCRRSARTRRSCWTVTLWIDLSTLWYLNSFSSSSIAAPRLGTGERRSLVFLGLLLTSNLYSCLLSSHWCTRDT